MDLGRQGTPHTVGHLSKMVLERINYIGLGGHSRKWGLAQDWVLAGGRGSWEIGYPNKSYLEGGAMKPGSGWGG